jgi:BNR repeat-like domain
MAAVSAILAAACTSDAPPPTEPAAAPELPTADEGLEEELEELEERTRGREEELEEARRAGTLGLIEPLVPNPAPGWMGERLWHPTADDWEPAVAGRRDSNRVYMLTTRFGGKKACPTCPDPAIRLKVSHDGGLHWGKDRYLCRCPGGPPQYDPQIELASDGSVHAVWLDDFDPGIAYTRSDDGGKTWTDPVHVDKKLAWSDKPALTISDDGQDVYVLFNGPTLGDGYVAVSHDGGDTWGQPVPATKGTRYNFAYSGVVMADGRVVLSQTSYTQNSEGRVRVLATISEDGGQTWQNVELDRLEKQPECLAVGCTKDYYGPLGWVAIDRTGGLAMAYNGAVRHEGPQRIFVRHSGDGGVTWGDRTRLSPKKANAAFPAMLGGATGELRLWFMDDRRGAHDRWNVWYRETADGGQTWSEAVQISDASGGTVYKKPRGFLEPYGDYGEITLTAGGATLAVWGEAVSYFGPGGTWYNRTRG